MQFSRLISFALFFLTFGMFVMGAVVEKRADLETVISDLGDKTHTILDSITAAKAANQSDLVIAGEVTKLTALWTDAAVKIPLTKLSTGLSKRQSADTIAPLIAGLLKEIATTLDGLTGSGLIAALLPGLDTSLNAVLSSLEVLLANVLKLVATLLEDVAGLLRSLALGLTLGSLFPGL